MEEQHTIPPISLPRADTRYPGGTSANAATLDALYLYMADERQDATSWTSVRLVIGVASLPLGMPIELEIFYRLPQNQETTLP